MTKDKGIGELPGIAPAAVVGLTSAGIVSVADLVAADFDRVAYIVDDYNEAARLLREAAKDVPGTISMPPGRRSRASHHDAPSISTPVVRSPVRAQPIAEKAAPAAAPARTRIETREPRESREVRTMREMTREARDTREPATAGGLNGAMDMAIRDLRLGRGESGAQARATLRRRLDAASVLLEHGADEQEVCAALLLEPSEAGTIEGADLSKRFGASAGTLVQECTALRAIPMLPSGNLPRSYTDMARAASLSARRVCAAYLLSTDRRGGAAWHARLLSEALAVGEPDELVTLARTTVERTAERAAA